MPTLLANLPALPRQVAPAGDEAKVFERLWCTSSAAAAAFYG